MSDTKVITITVSGPVQSGKSACVKQIEKLLTAYGYGCVVADRAYRNNQPDCLDTCATHERPEMDKTVFVLEEVCVHEKTGGESDE